MTAWKSSKIEGSL